MKKTQMPLAGASSRTSEQQAWKLERDALERQFLAQIRKRRFGRKKGIHDVPRQSLGLSVALRYATWLLQTDEIRFAIQVIVTTPIENLKSVPAVHSEEISSFRDWFALKHDQLGTLHALRRSEQLAGEVVLGRISSLESAEARSFLLESRHILEDDT